MTKGLSTPSDRKLGQQKNRPSRRFAQKDGLGVLNLMLD